MVVVFFFSSRRRHTRLQGDWSSDVCSSDLGGTRLGTRGRQRAQGQGAKGEARLAAIDAEGAVFHGLSPSRCWACWVAWPYAGNARAALVFSLSCGSGWIIQSPHCVSSLQST